MLKLLHTALCEHVKNTPEAIACIDGAEQFTYQHLYQQAENLARYFQSRGLKGERIALQLPNSYKLLIAYLSCFLSGVIAVPISLSLKQPEIDYIILQTEPKLYISEDFDFEQKSDVPLDTVNSDDPVAIFYTSGSTGKPKGVTHSYRSMSAMIDCLADAADLTSKDRFVVVEPMSNASGCCHGFLAVYVGGTSIILPKFTTDNFLKMTQYHPTVISIMGKTNYDIVHDPHLTQEYFKGMRMNLSGGDKITESLMKDFKQKTGFPIRLGYGMSEFLVLVTNKSNREDKLTSVGTVAKHVEIELRDANRQPVLQGNVGEIWARGPNCMLGYWNDEITTRGTLIDGWIKTGDLGKQDTEGFLWFLGRIKHMIIRDGDNISPLEIEEALALHPAVHCAAVIGVPHLTEGQVPKAFVELKKDSQASENELIMFLKTQLEDYKVPISVTIMNALPRTSNGKISRKDLL